MVVCEGAGCAVGEGGRGAEGHILGVVGVLGVVVVGGGRG